MINLLFCGFVAGKPVHSYPVAANQVLARICKKQGGVGNSCNLSI